MVLWHLRPKRRNTHKGIFEARMWLMWPSNIGDVYSILFLKNLIAIRQQAKICHQLKIITGFKSEDPGDPEILKSEDLGAESK